MIAFRPLRDDDVGYVKATWAKTARAMMKRGRARDAAGQALESLMDAVFDSPDGDGRGRAISVLIACSAGLESTILGYVVIRRRAAMDERVPIFAYVARDCRGKGIGTQLLRFATDPQQLFATENTSP